MCQHAPHTDEHAPDTHAPDERYGSRLEHGAAHTADHARWTRRSFLGALGAAAGTFALGGLSVRGYARAPLLARLAAADTDRVLVVVQLGGGNDGLNTVVPFADDAYYRLRPTLGVPAGDVLRLDDRVGLHPALGRLSGAWGDGRLAVLQSVGYPDPSLSHFRATDIWTSASASDVYDATGWGGRYLGAAFPDFAETPPPAPLAVQIGGGASSLFHGDGANLGMTLASVDLFDRIAERGTLYDADAVPATAYGDEMRYLRTVANDAFTYAGAIQSAADGSANRADYPGGPLAPALSVVARLVRGGLGARLYHVTLGGFDTHANQAGAHAALLATLGDTLAAFFDDLAADGLDERVLAMTFSEFGRRPGENGSRGTDHGTAAPLFLLGGGVQGGLYGAVPDLGALGTGENLPFDLDFRSAYAAVLGDWFGLDDDALSDVLGGDFPRLPIVQGTSVAAEPRTLPNTLQLDPPYPNPFRGRTTVAFTLDAPAPVRLRAFDAAGRLVRTLADASFSSGRHEVAFDSAGLAAGTYLVRLEAGGAVRTRAAVHVR